jgi:hypothetical protein
MLLLCASLAWAGDKPVQVPSDSFAVQQALHEEPAPTVQRTNPRDCILPTNSQAEAIQFLEREAYRMGLKGERQAGDDCTQPISVTLGAGDLPYVTSDTTYGRYNDYFETDLDKYDGGEDIIYELTLTEPMSLRINVFGSSWTGVAIDTGRPGLSCLATAVDHAGAPSMDVDLAAGTYYLMIDTWPSPDYTDFTMTINTRTPCIVPCPGGATLEGEPDCADDQDDNFNGGCNSTPAVFSDISCGETVCGKSGTFLFGGSSYRDTDWYRLEMTAPGELTWTAKAEFQSLIFIIDAGSENCSDYAILTYTTGGECEEISVSATVGTGVYWLWVGPSVYTGYPCDGEGSNYVATAICEEPEPCDVDFSVTAPGGWSGSTCGAGNDCDLRPSEDHMYEVTIPNTGMWTVSMCGSSYDTYLFIGTTCCGQEIGYNDDFCGLQSEMTQMLSAGTYYVAVEGYSGCGSYVLNIFELVGGDNDLCENAEPIDSPYPVTVGGSNIGATIDCPDLLAWTAVWYDIELPYAENNLQVTTCPDNASMSTTGIIVMDDCLCDDYIIRDGGLGFFTCPSGWTGYDMVFSCLPGPGRILLPSYFLGAPGGDTFQLTIDVTECVPCEVECDPAATPEGEPPCGPNYDDTFNGGCNSAVPVFSPITCGETVLGESGTFLWFGSSYRDTDWYEITLSQPATLTWDVVAEFDLLIFVIDAGSGNCADYAILGSATAEECDHATLSVAVDVGTYWLWVGPSVFSGIPCGAEYCATVTTDPETACTLTGACCLLDGTCVETTEEDCDAQDGGYQGDETECAEPPPPPPPECENPDALVQIVILTDPYPSEITWTLVENGYGVVASGRS